MTRRVGGPILFLTVAALVFAGLGWVTVAALRVEQSQRETAARAELEANLRVALWKLDGRMLPTLSVEDSRPYYHFSGGEVIANYGPASAPLLENSLPDYMLLHAQVDPTAGWSSPQVLTPEEFERLRRTWPDMSCANATPERAKQLDKLRTDFPAVVVCETFSARDRVHPGAPLATGPFTRETETYQQMPAPGPVVPPAAEPVTAESAETFSRNEPKAKQSAIDEAGALPQKELPGPLAAAQPQRAAGIQPPPAMSNSTGNRAIDNSNTMNVPAPRVVPQAQQLGARGGRDNNDQRQMMYDTPRVGTISKAMQEAGRAGAPQFGHGKGSPQQNYGQNFGQGGPIPQPPSGPGSGAGGGAGNTQPGGGFNSGGLGGFGGGNLGAAPGGPPPGMMPAPKPDPATPGIGGPGGRPGGGEKALKDTEKLNDPKPAARFITEKRGDILGGFVERDNFAMKKRAEEPKFQAESLKAGEGTEAKKFAEKEALGFRDALATLRRAESQKKDEAKVANDAERSRTTGGEEAKTEGATTAAPVAAAVVAPPPVSPPFVAHLGAMRPQWLAAADGTEVLVLMRAAKLDDKTVYQGVVLDWAKLEEVLRGEVRDLFPAAKLVPVRDPAGVSPERAMASLPVQLDPGAPAELPPAGMTPLRFGLVLAWVAAFIAFAAVGLSGWSLIDSSERKMRFVSAVTHELRTPLTSLRLYIDLLLSGMVEDVQKRKEYLATLNVESDRLHRLIDNVLDYARLEGTRRAAAGPVLVVDLLDQVRQTWGDRCGNDGKELVVVSTLPPEQTVCTDLALAQQIVGNLIDNARKYTRDAADRRIWLWAKPDGSKRVVIEVEDRGPGVPPRERKDIFRPFRRGGSADTRAGGAGLGLALAKQWAEALGGRLTYRPADCGTGACFRLELRVR